MPSSTEPSGYAASTASTSRASDALRYLTNRYDSRLYAQAREQGLPIGSGVVEGAHRHALQARLKLSGAWWKPNNANAMAKRRVAKSNGQWDSLWANATAA